jgi:hypothetical protein
MPRDQETSIGHDQAASDDPLFRSPDDQRGDPLRDPLEGDDDTGAGPGHTPIGDKVAAGRHAGDRDLDTGDGTGDEPSGAPGEWVAGSKGPGYVAGRDGTVVPDQPGQPSAERTDPVTGDPLASDTRTTPEASDNGHPTAAMDPDADAPVVTDADTTGPDASTHPDTVTDRDTLTDPDAPTDPDALAATEAPGTPATPAATAATGTAEATPGSATSSTTPDTATPAAPVPGAPGTGSTTGVQAASAALVTHGAELHDDWARIQSSFVDDPRGSVSQAADLVSQVTNSLVNALQERERTLRGAWDQQGGADTENLRNALRDYRAFFEMLTRV